MDSAVLIESVEAATFGGFSDCAGKDTAFGVGDNIVENFAVTYMTTELRSKA